MLLYSLVLDYAVWRCGILSVLMLYVKMEGCPGLRVLICFGVRFSTALLVDSFIPVMSRGILYMYVSSVTAATAATATSSSKAVVPSSSSNSRASATCASAAVDEEERVKQVSKLTALELIIYLCCVFCMTGCSSELPHAP